MRNHIVLMMLIAGCIALSACAAESIAPVTPDTPDTPDTEQRPAVAGELIPFEHIASVTLSDVKKPTYTLITDRESWVKAWSALVAAQLWPPPPPAPTIDFDSQAVILAGAGDQPTQLVSFRIEEVRLRDGTLHVLVHEDWPSPQCGSLPVITQPVHVVSVPRLASTAEFTTRRTSSC
jgi:hypothetical protein